MARLTGQTIAAGVLDFDAVYLDGGTWRLASATNYPGGIYEGDGVVVTDGTETLDGEFKFEIVFEPVVEGSDEGYFRAVSDAVSSPDNIILWGRAVDEHVPTDVEEIERTPGRYGSALESIVVGKAIPLDLAGQEVSRNIREVLLQHPLILKVSEFEIGASLDDFSVGFRVTTSNGGVVDISGTLGTLTFEEVKDPEVVRGGDGSIAIGETPRYPGIYGSSLETLFVGNVLPADLIESEVRREISEVLKKHPAIETVTEFGVDTDGDEAEFSFKVITVDGTEIGGSAVSGVSGVVVETVTIGGDGSIAISETGRYPGRYGTALEAMTIGRTIPDDLAASEITREIRRSLLQHPDIADVGAFEITLTDDAGKINFTVSTASGETFTAGV